MSNPERVDRIQKIDPPSNRSAFLWGPRKSGKTTLLRQQFPEAYWIDLLDYDLFLSLSQRPSSLRQILDAPSSKTVVIDEVQKMPPKLYHFKRTTTEKNLVSGHRASLAELL